MSNPLMQKLENLDDRARDEQLLKVWKAFEGTDQYHALEFLLSQLDSVADSEILNPGSMDSRRTFAAGEKHLIRSLRNSMRMILDTDPASLQYEEPAKTDPPGYTEEPPPPVDEDYTASQSTKGT